MTYILQYDILFSYLENNMHISKVINILDEKLKPANEVACIGCINGIWRLEKSKTNVMNDDSVSCYCKVFYKETYQSQDGFITTDCDGFADTLPEKD